MKQLDVIGLGAMNLDLLYRVEQLVADGESAVLEHVRQAGGSAANTVYGLARLGMKTSFMGAIGNDRDGKLLLRDFSRVGVDTSQIAVKPGVQTGSLLCLTAQQGGRALYVFPGANGTLSAEDVNKSYVNQARFLHLSSFTGQTQMLAQLMVLASLSPSVKVSFSPGALYARKGLLPMAHFLKKTHVLFLNKTEIEGMTRREFQAGAHECLALGCRIVVVTLGEGIKRRGKRMVCFVATGEGECWTEGAAMDKQAIVDTTGAGDAFAAGFLYGLLREKNVEECGYLGDIMARFSLTRLGARVGLPTLSQLARSYRQRRAEMLQA